MKQPFLSGIPLRLRLRVYFARHRKNVNENLGLIIALLAAAFAGWSGYEAHAARKDALAGLKTAQRGYIDVRGHKLGYSGYVAGNPLVSYSHTLAVYGSSPAFQISDKVTCRVGTEDRFKLHFPVTEHDLAFFSSHTVALVELGQPTPDELVPGGSYSPEYGCSLVSLPRDLKEEPKGVIAFGVVTYKDIFGEAHYKNFCYYNPGLAPSALASSKTPGEPLAPCPIHNDGN